MGSLFSGVMQGAIHTNMDGAHGIAGWRWLFIIEGAMTVIVAIGGVWVLPDWPGNTVWLTEREKALASLRIQSDNIGVGGSHQMGHVQSLKAALTDWRTYIFTFMDLMISEQLS